MSTADMGKSCREHVKSCHTESHSVQESRFCGVLPSEESKRIEGLLTEAWGDNWSRPLSADELLDIGRETLEPLFHEPPLGPIPEYLRPHLRVHGCVAEYEDKIAEIDSWKARALDVWLKNRIGQKCIAGQRLHVLRLEEGRSSTADKYWLELIEDGDSEEI